MYGPAQPSFCLERVFAEVFDAGCLGGGVSCRGSGVVGGVVLDTVNFEGRMGSINLLGNEMPHVI